MKYNVEKNAKMLKEFQPDNIDRLLIWAFLIIGLYFYEFYPEHTALLGVLSAGLMYKLGFYICWTIHSFIHVIYCKNKGIDNLL